VHVDGKPVISKSYKGRHRAPSKTRTRAALTVAGVATALTMGFGGSASADPLGAIAQCESGGNIRAQNPSSTASGKYQFLDSTWRGLGGKGSAKDASEAEQDRMARKLYNQSGTTPWNPSKACWKGKAGGKIRTADKQENDRPVIRQADKPAQKAKPAKARTSAPQKGYVIQKGDTLGKLAQRHGTSVQALMSKNPGIKNPHRIRAGATLRV
jgi:LysM repeat protein